MIGSAAPHHQKSHFRSGLTAPLHARDFPRGSPRKQVVFKYTEALALDLRVFAKHGKRAVVGVDDVKCVARKDPKLVSSAWNVFLIP